MDAVCNAAPVDVDSLARDRAHEQGQLSFLMPAEPFSVKVPAEVRSIIEAGALLVVNSSGGKDSQALLIELLKVVPSSQMLVVHASLGEIEWDGALELAEEQARAAGIPFIVARANKTLLDMVEQRFALRPEVPSWPDSARRQCTSDMKRGPIEREIRRYAKTHGYSTIINCAGMRAQESASRSKYPVWKRSDRNSISTREWFEWLPIHAMSTDEVFASIRDAGQQPHWAYGEGNRRLSCVFCLFGHPRDLANGARLRPELYARYLEMERRTGYTMHQSRKPLHELVETGMRAAAA